MEKRDKLKEKTEKFTAAISKKLAECMERHFLISRLPAKKKKLFASAFSKRVERIAEVTSGAEITLLEMRKTKNEAARDKLVGQYRSSVREEKHFAYLASLLMGTIGDKKTDLFTDDAQSIFLKELKKYFPLTNYLSNSWLSPIFEFAYCRSLFNMGLDAAKLKGKKLKFFKPSRQNQLFGS